MPDGSQIWFVADTGDEASRRLREARDDPARGLDRSTVSDADAVPCVDMSKDVA
ncbi:hypothetical protein [Actinophytocola xinjiangensis]|uniref:hypothetical protein n=1 Tax=Actinophytocola xinjiangensis TaxID=485602 RepID=UPI000B1E24AE|nr:hypothetical protein [Actinophytocola xinjiangensis]